MKLTKKRGSKFGAVVAPSDAKEKNRNIGAQLQSILYITAQNRFGKIYFLYDFWCAQTCSFRVDPPAEIFLIIGWLTNLNGWLAG